MEYATNPPGENGSDAMAQALVRFNAHVMGAMLALVCGIGLFATTLVLLVQGGPMTGQMLGLLSHFFPGYGISLGGAFLGSFWAGLLGYGVGYIVGRAYGPWLLRGATHVLKRQSGSRQADAPGTASVIELRALPFATVSGLLAAGALFCATNWLYFRYGGHPSPHLELLSHYLPGYSTNFFGSFVGAFWLFLYSFVGAFCVAWVYDRVVVARSQ